MALGLQMTIPVTLPLAEEMYLRLSEANGGAEVKDGVSRSADELCSEILDHMLGCDQCLNGNEHSCPIYQRLDSQIIALGGASKGMVFAI